MFSPPTPPTSSSSPTDGSNSSTLSREEQTRLFQQKFQEFLSQGYDKSTAAAEAIKFALGQNPNPESRPKLQTSSSPQPPPLPPSRPISPLPPVKISSVIMDQLVQECSASGSFTPILRLINEVFSSPKLLSVCFGLDAKCSDDMLVEGAGEGESEEASPPLDSIQLNFDEIRHVYSLILTCGHEGVVNSVLYAFLTLTSDMQIHSKSYNNIPRYLKLYFIILLHPNILDPQFLQALKPLFEAWNNLSPSSKDLLVDFIQTTSPEIFLIIVKILHQIITIRVSQGSIKEARLGVKSLDLFHIAYQKQNHLKNSISPSEFYIQEVSDYISPIETRKREYQLWLRDLGTTNTATYIPTQDLDRQNFDSFISFPYLLTPGVKASIIELDANVQMRQGMQQEYEEALASGSQYMSPYLVLRVRRNNIVADTVNHFVAVSENDYKKPLKVVFDSEEGVDAGGVRKEFYQIMMKELLDPNYGMFKYFPSSHLLWFNSDSFESDVEFELIGILLGIAIYNSIIVDFRMPKVIYKKLKGEFPTLEDLAELQPDLANGLEQLLQFPGDVQSAFQFTFQISYESLGEIKTIDLKENGSEIFVTNETREEYVSLYVDYILNKSVVTQFEAFNRGFKKVCGGAALDLFTTSELELLICGNPVLDFSALQSGTRYDDGYDGSEEIITQFWEILHSFNEEEKRKFLKFVSGSDRSPIDGLAHMKFVVSKNGNDDERLPSAHTCFNHLLLPQYSTKQILEQKLRYCIEESEGFGLR